MRSLYSTPSALGSGLRWAARLLAAALVGLVLVILVGEGFNPLNLKAVEAVQMTFFFTTCAGLVVAWRWQVIGGALATAGMLCFFAVESVVTGGPPRGLVFYLMLLAGLLFLLCGFVRWRGATR
jgi:hypothetical protein